MRIIQSILRLALTAGLLAVAILAAGPACAAGSVMIPTPIYNPLAIPAVSPATFSPTPNPASATPTSTPILAESDQAPISVCGVSLFILGLFLCVAALGRQAYFLLLFTF